MGGSEHPDENIICQESCTSNAVSLDGERFQGSGDAEISPKKLTLDRVLKVGELVRDDVGIESGNGGKNSYFRLAIR